MLNYPISHPKKQIFVLVHVISDFFCHCEARLHVIARSVNDEAIPELNPKY